MIDKILAILEEAKQEIKQNLENFNINASGRTSDSLIVYETEEGARLASDKSNGAAPFIEVVEIGMPALEKIPNDFVGVINQWIKDKGLSSGNEKEDRKFAGAIVYGKLKKVGYGRPSPSLFGSVQAEIYTPVVEKATKKIIDEVLNSVIETIKNNK